MGEKRFNWDGDILFDSLELRELGNCLEAKDIADLLNELNDENRQLKQILKDIVEVTDETYTKNKNMFKVTVVFDYKKYREIRECLND